MRGWLGGVAALLLYLGATAGAAPVDCGPAPSVECLAAEIFSLAKSVPDRDNRIAFAEQELAPGDIKVALEYVVWDTPDPSAWEDIEWMARAGRFDQAIKRARQRTSSFDRLGGLLATAAHILDRNDTGRAQALLEEVERELPSIPDDADSDVYLLFLGAGELRARLGQADRAIRLISGRPGAVERFLAIAAQYPAAASLREQAWQEADRNREPYQLQQLIEDAISRGDRAEIALAVQRLGGMIDYIASANSSAWATLQLAKLVLKAGSPDLAGKLIKSWPQWLAERTEFNQSDWCRELVPVLVGLAREGDVEAAARAVDDAADRSQCLSKAAEEYFRAGRRELAEKLDTEALAVAESSSTRDPKLAGKHQAALHNHALSRAGRGDIDGALIAAAKLRDDTRIRVVTGYVVQRAIAGGHAQVVAPAIQTLEERASAANDVDQLLQVSSNWYAIGKTERARRSLAEVQKIIRDRGSPPHSLQLAIAAELTWRLSGRLTAQSLFEIVDKLGANEPRVIDLLVEAVRPGAPTIALQLTGRQSDGELKIAELANIAIQIAEGKK